MTPAELIREIDRAVKGPMDNWFKVQVIELVIQGYTVDQAIELINKRG